MTQQSQRVFNLGISLLTVKIVRGVVGNERPSFEEMKLIRFYVWYLG